MKGTEGLKLFEGHVGLLWVYYKNFGDRNRTRNGELKWKLLLRFQGLYRGYIRRQHFLFIQGWKWGEETKKRTLFGV